MPTKSDFGALKASRFCHQRDVLAFQMEVNLTATSSVAQKDQKNYTNNDPNNKQLPIPRSLPY